MIRILITILILMADHRFALAQNTSGTDPQSSASLKLEDFGINKGSRFYQEPSSDDSDRAEPLSDEQIMTYRGLVQHKKYDQGIIIKVKTKPEISDEQMKDVERSAKESFDRILKKVIEPKMLRTCADSGKETLRVELLQQPENSVVFKDILIL